MEDFINLIVNNGMAVVIMAYFLYKDYKFNDNIIEVLSELKELMAVVNDHMSGGNK